jgi:hypothetical protein
MVASDGTDTLLTTSSAYTAATVPTGPGTGVVSSTSNSAYTNSQFGSTGAKWRLVACDLAVQCIGAEVDLNGQFYLLHEPDNGDLGGKTSAALANYVNSRIVAVDSRRQWVGVSWYPANNSIDDTQFSTTAPSSTTDKSLAILFEGDSSKSLSFAVQAHAIYECIGPNVTNTSRTHVDPEGAAAAQSALQLIGDAWVGIKSRSQQMISATLSELAKMSFHTARNYGMNLAFNAVTRGMSGPFGQSLLTNG